VSTTHAERHVIGVVLVSIKNLGMLALSWLSMNVNVSWKQYRREALLQLLVKTEIRSYMILQLILLLTTFVYESVAVHLLRLVQKR